MGLYRSRNGRILGVCRGVAEHLGVNPFWIRLLALFFLLTSFGWAILVYFLAALLMKPEPMVPLETPEEAEFYHSYATSRTAALQRLQRTFDRMERRIQRMEQVVTERDFDWNERLNGDCRNGKGSRPDGEVYPN